MTSCLRVGGLVMKWRGRAAVRPNACTRLSILKECKKYTCSCENTADCLCTVLGNYVKACAEKETYLVGWRTGRCGKQGRGPGHTASFPPTPGCVCVRPERVWLQICPWWVQNASFFFNILAFLLLVLFHLLNFSLSWLNIFTYKQCTYKLKLIPYN